MCIRDRPLRLPILFLLAILASALTGLAAPFVQSFTPNAGPPGTLVTLNGSGFRPTAALPIVQFGTIQANLISVSANTIVVVVPEGATIGPITVTAMPIGNGQYTTPGYFYLPPRVTDFGTRMIGGANIEFEKPVIASPGATLTIVGANFYVPNFPRLLVRVGEIPVNAVVTADTQIRATLPQWIETGYVSVHTEVGGTTNFQQLVYGAPLISRFTATAKGGDTIEVHGYNFRTRNAAEFELRIGGAKATVDVLSNTNLTAIVPDAAINGPLQITVPGGAFITPSHIVIQPRITSFTPNTGAAGTVVKAARDVGLSFDRDGVLQFDKDKLAAQLKDNFAEVAQMFTANVSNQSTYSPAAGGVAGDAVKKLDAMMRVTGSVQQQTDSARNQVKRYQADLEKLEEQMKKLLERYTQQFASMESVVGNSNRLRESLKGTFEGLANAYKN